MYSSNLKGFILAVVSSAFIGSSFIIKKKGLRRAGVNGPRASVGGYGYLLEPLWWIGMITSMFFRRLVSSDFCFITAFDFTFGLSIFRWLLVPSI